MNKQQLQKEITELQKQLEERQKALAAMPDKWEPKGGDYWVDNRGQTCFMEGSSQKEHKSFGNEYPTREQAEKAAKAMRAHNRLLAYVAEFAPDWEPDWSNEYQLKTEVVFDARYAEWVIENSTECYSPSVVYMPEHIAKELCDKLNSGEVEL